MRVSSRRTTSRWGYDLTTTIYCCNPSCQNRPECSTCQCRHSIKFLQTIISGRLGWHVEITEFDKVLQLKCRYIDTPLESFLSNKTGKVIAIMSPGSNID